MRARAGAQWCVPGAEDFLAVIADAPQEQQVFLRRLAEWAIGLGKRGLVPQLSTYHGKASITTLLLRLSGGAGLVTIYKDTRSAYLQLFRSVFERRAPRSMAAVEAAIGEPLRQAQQSPNLVVHRGLAGRRSRPVDAVLPAPRPAVQWRSRGGTRS